jgi:hypothetical protein
VLAAAADVKLQMQHAHVQLLAGKKLLQKGAAAASTASDRHAMA